MHANSDYINEKTGEGLMEHDTASLLQQCLKNDRKAQRQLFENYKHRVHDLVYKSLGPKFDVDDVIQQVFIELFKSLSYFKGDSSLDTWVYRICVKVCTTQLRKKYRKRQPQIVFDSLQMEIEADAGVVDPCEEMEKKELEAAVYAAFEKLDEEKRMTVVLYEMEGKSLEEISVITGIALGTVKSRLFHGRKLLEKHLRRYMGK
jgi:RNA polymerase sigma-70 factor (ECF subfamily)